MNNYIIYINDLDVGRVSGDEAAWEAYRKAIDLCEILGGECTLANAETGEYIASFGYCEEDEEEYSPVDPDECGFDPYEGCYTFDC